MGSLELQDKELGRHIRKDNANPESMNKLRNPKRRGRKLSVNNRRILLRYKVRRDLAYMADSRRRGPQSRVQN